MVDFAERKILPLYFLYCDSLICARCYLHKRCFVQDKYPPCSPIVPYIICSTHFCLVFHDTFATHATQQTDTDLLAIKVCILRHKRQACSLHVFRKIAYYERIKQMKKRALVK